MSVNFKTTREDSETIAKIAARARDLFGGDLTDWVMDITATHANGCPLDLNGLLSAEPFDFAHDIEGICDHLDRTSGKLSRGFSPRFEAQS